MNTLILSLILFALPAQAQEATGGLQCQYDANTPKDPYAKMKKENEDKIAAGIKSMGITVGRLPRQDMVTGLNTHLAQLCWAKKSMENIANSITAKKKEADTVAAGQQGCEAYSSINRQLGSFKGANKTYQETLGKALREQRGRYQKFLKDDELALQAHKQNPAVVKAFREAWGKLPHEKGEGGAGILSTPIAQIKEEQDLNGSRDEGYNNLAGSIQSLKEKCPSLGDIDPMKASAQKPKPGNEWGTMAPDATAETTPEATPETIPENTITNTTTPEETVTTTPEEDPNKTPYYDPDKKDPNPELIGPVKEKSGGIGDWAARNKGMLILGAGTAAVVGGALWYKHKQDKKEEETNAWINDQVNSATATSTVTSTSTSTSTSTAAKTLSVDGFPPSASTNYIMPAIKATVSGSSSDGINVTIACVSTCSLAGTLTKKTVNGSVEFSDLYFTAPHDGVQLRVSAPNMNSVASPGSFNVITSGRQ